MEQIVKMLGQDEDDWSLLFAVCSDKDYESMISMLSAIPWKHIYITKIETARGAGVAVNFGLKLVEKVHSKEESLRQRNAILCD